jgi:uncharacterized protein (UPF0335 family)
MTVARKQLRKFPTECERVDREAAEEVEAAVSAVSANRVGGRHA